MRSFRIRNTGSNQFHAIKKYLFYAREKRPEYENNNAEIFNIRR